MPMAISFPDTVSSATQLSDAAVRLNSTPSAKSQVASTDQECGACSAQESRKATDEDFDAVLAWMINGFVVQVQPPAVAESTDMSLTSESVVTDAAGMTSPMGFGPTTAQVGTTTTQGTAAASAQSQNVMNITDDFTSAVSVGSGNPEPPTTTAVAADQSLNGAATPIGSQSVPGSSNQQSIDGFGFLPTGPLLFGPAVGAVAEIHEGQIAAFNLSVVKHSDLSGTSEALSQDAMHALEQIGRLPGSVISQAQSSALPVAATQVTTPSVAAASVAVLPVANASMTITSVTGTSEKDATGNREPSIEVTSDQTLASNVAVASKNVEPMNQPVRGGTSFASDLPVLDNSAFPFSREPHAAAAPSYDAVRSDMVQPNAANSLPNLATSISSEMRQPLSNQVSQAIMEHIERNGVRRNDSLTVRLDPPELGEMTIELSKTHEGLAVRVTASEAVTMDMLFARGQEIESHLRGQQMNLKSLEFLHADTSGNQFSQGQQQSDPSRRSGNSLNQVRRGSRNSSPANADDAGIATLDSIYGLSFRA